uniref:NADH-ubiquinone oxidoreductase chain 2 n=1 Tax=Geukensia demissa TaxID=27807 RepID=A0A6B9VNQ5_GEUDE|nr:NADH dehydrogenase subunit 2 [Geukensia demissa]
MKSSSLLKFSFISSPLVFISIVVVILSSLVSITSSSWLMVWISMEVNLMSFIVLLYYESSCSVEACVKYFIVQSLGSYFMLLGFLCFDKILLEVCLKYFLMMGLLMKGGVFPFHSWVPSVVNSSNWFASALILSWQKLAPLLALSIFLSCVFLKLSVIMMAVLGGIGGLNQHSVRSMLSYSSFVHTSWMILSLYKSFFIFFMYWFVYSISVVFVMWCCYAYNKEFMKSQSRVVLGSSGLLMLSGLPPFIGFSCKVLVFMSVNSPVVFFCMLGSLISLKFYLSFIYNFFMTIMLDSKILNYDSFFAVFFFMYLNMLGFVCLALFIFL